MFWNICPFDNRVVECCVLTRGSVHGNTNLTLLFIFLRVKGATFLNKLEIRGKISESCIQQNFAACLSGKTSQIRRLVNQKSAICFETRNTGHNYSFLAKAKLVNPIPKRNSCYQFNNQTMIVYDSTTQLELFTCDQPDLSVNFSEDSLIEASVPNLTVQKKRPILCKVLERLHSVLSKQSKQFKSC